MCALVGSELPGDVAAAVTAYVREREPWALLAPSTAFGREVAARAAAATGSGLVGDAVALLVTDDGTLVAAKPAFAGALVADITSRSPPAWSPSARCPPAAGGRFQRRQRHHDHPAGAGARSGSAPR